MATTINIWNRLEGRARQQEFGRALRAEVRDPLWMLARQWQMGEFMAEDNGSPIKASVAWDTSPLQKVSMRKGKASTLNVDEKPLEAEVEKIRAPLDLFLRMEMGRYWGKLLRANSLASTLNAFRSEIPFVLPNDTTFDDRYSNAELLVQKKQMCLLHAAVQSKAVDGGALYETLANTSKKASEIIGQNNSDLNDLGKKFVAWFDERYSQPDQNDNAWHSSHMEYQFDCSLSDNNGNDKVLHAEEFHQGRLDWYSFDFAKISSADATLTQNLSKRSVSKGLTFIPTEIDFPGIPRSRWWEFEDAKTNLANLTVNKEDSGKLVFTKFSLLYSNDWAVVPINMPVNSLVKIDSITVTDVFGQKTLVKHYGKNKAEQPWSFFNLHNEAPEQVTDKEDHLLLPPVLNNPLEGKPIASVALVRDEMANMVWGIETVVPDILGAGRDGYEKSLALKSYFENLDSEKSATLGTVVPVAPIVNEAQIQYKISTTVPENWIPFIAVRQDDTGHRQIQLQRAAMPRILENFPAQRIRPQTPLLRTNLDNTRRSDKRFYIFEEEVPRSGVLVNLSWQRVRWYDGRVVLWLGYQKTNGRGEGNSGLMFDQIVPVQTK